jgi:hypothetical protein
VIASDGGKNYVQTNSLIILPNLQLIMLLGSMSHVFIEGGSAGGFVPLSYGSYGLLTPLSSFPFTSPPSRRVVPSHSNWTLPCFIPYISLHEYDVHLVFKD